MSRRVQGLDSLNRKLTQAIPQRAKEVTRQAMEKSAEEIVKMMKQLVPKGETGRLAESIGWTYGDAPEGTMAIMSGDAGDGGIKITIYAGGGEAYYARFVEFGTQNMSAQPFFYPAYRMNRRRAKNRIRRAIRKGVKEASQT